MCPKPLSKLVDPARSAVLIVDAQNDYCHPDRALARAGAPTGAAMTMLPALARFLEHARCAGAPLIFIRTIHESWTDSEVWRERLDGASGSICRAGTWGAEFCVVAPHADEPIVVKHRYSGFFNTRLDSILRALQAQSVIMTGVSTNVCVESTARDAFIRDYNVVLLADCTAAYSDREHEAAQENIRRYFGAVATSEEVADVWHGREYQAPGANFDE